MAVHVAQHPLVKHKLGLLRKHDITTSLFRDVTKELARLLTYEATKDLQVEKKTIKGWAGEVESSASRAKRSPVGAPFCARGARHVGRGFGHGARRKGSVVGFYRQCRKPSIGEILRKARQRHQGAHGPHPGTHAGHRRHA